jgi:hypothetical protein
MTPQAFHARTLIDLLHPQPAAETLIEITGLAPKTAPVKRYFTGAEVATEAVMELNDARYSVFVSLNPRKQMTGFETDVPFVTTLGLDLQPERTSISSVLERLALGGVHPTARAVSGHGEHMYFRVAAAEPYKAKPVWARLCKFTGSDPVFNCNRIFRCAGTLNWKKDPPRWCYLTEVHAERVYTVGDIDAVLDRLGAPPPKPPAEGIPIDVDLSANWFELRRRLSPGVLDILDTGEKNAYSEKQVTRSEADWVVVCALVRAGASDDLIAWIYNTQNVRLLKYHEAGARYLARTIETARRATAERKDRVASPRSSLPAYYGGARDAISQRYAQRMYR